MNQEVKVGNVYLTKFGSLYKVTGITSQQITVVNIRTGSNGFVQIVNDCSLVGTLYEPSVDR